MAIEASDDEGGSTKEFPYQLRELHWAADHKSNTEGVYCYCGNDKEPDEPMLPCQSCHQLFHSGCVSCLPKPLLKGDEFFKFQCAVCTQGPEVFERAALSWVILVHLVLYNLMDASPNQQYFRWKEEICKFIYDYWSYLLPDKEQSPTWNNTVASVLSVQNHIFLSGVETKGASGWWTLIEMAPPDRNRKLKPKNKVVAKAGSSRVAGTKHKDKRARSKGSPSKKKTRFDETSSDDDFHTSAKPRPQSSAPTTRIKSRQFSLSSGSSLSSAGDSDDSLEDDDAFWKSEDEKEMRPTVFLHGIPACIQHHFNPSGLDFSAGPIDLEHLFRLSDLIDDDSPGRLISRVRSAVNSVGGILSLSGKKKRRKSSVAEIKPEVTEQIVDESHYSQGLSDLSEDELAVGYSTDEGSEVDDSNADSDGNDIEQAHGRVMAAKRTAGKQFNYGTSPRFNSVTLENHLAPPTSGGKYGRRKSSLKDPSAAMEASRKSKKSVSMALPAASDTSSSYPLITARIGGGKKFSQAHLDALTKSRDAKTTHAGINQKSGAPSTPAPASAKTKARTKNNTVQGPTTAMAMPSAKASMSYAPPDHHFDGGAPTEAAAKASPLLARQQLKRQQEWHILQVLEDASKSRALPTIAARFKRKLHLKRLKSFLHLPLFDMDHYMGQHLASSLDLTQLSKHIPLDPYELRRHWQEQFMAKVQKIDHTPYGHSFASRLLGQPVECQTRKPREPLWKSPFSGKLLKDYIWRDYESRSVMMDVLDEIRLRQGRPAKVAWTRAGASESYGRKGKKRKRHESMPFGPVTTDPLGYLLQEEEEVSDQEQVSHSRSRHPIDYCYFKKEHLSQVNETLCRRFWPGIDMTDALLYPEFSVVVLYKRLVVGCAFMTPEGYITYVAVSAGWEKAGIGQFMLYHLMQASNGKDITLHVSANNPAMIMYQKFGFKPEQFLINFYKEYLPEDSTMCHNAFFVRLRR